MGYLAENPGGFSDEDITQMLEEVNRNPSEFGFTGVVTEEQLRAKLAEQTQ